MVASLSIPKTLYHVRSTSMPARSHPLTSSVEEKLNNLRGWEAAPSSPSSPSSPSHHSAEVLISGLCALRDLYTSIGELLCLPLVQQALSHDQQGKWADEILDGSLNMLDGCSNTKDIMLQMKGNLQDLQSALRRRRGGEPSMESSVGAYISSKKLMKKETEKCLKALKKVGSKCSFAPLCEKDQLLGAVVGVLREARWISTSIFESLLSFVSAERASSSFVPKWMRAGRVSLNEGEPENMTEVERVEAILYAIYTHKSHKDADVSLVQDAQKQLEGLEKSIEDLEDVLVSVFKQLIKTRVSLLNILNH